VKLIVLQSTQELLASARVWNDLWQRSECTWPTMRAEPLAQWMDTFAASGRTRILAIEKEGALVSALPLVEGRLGPLRIGKLPGGDLCSIGDLLLEEGLAFSNDTSPLDRLVEGIRSLRWPLIRFDAMFPTTRRWQALLQAFDRNGMHSMARHRGVTGVIDIGGDWETYFASRSRNHRRQMRVVHSRAMKEGKLELKLIANPPLEQIEPLLRRGFEVEDRSWKGEGGSSTLRTPVAFVFFCEQAKLLSQSGHLLLAFLDLNDQTIAFEYGWQSKGVYHSLKVGYDESYHRLSPGQLLRYLMMEQLFKQDEIARVDYLGPLSEATGKWSTQTYPVSRLLVANGILGRMLLWGYSHKVSRRNPTTLASDIGPNGSGAGSRESEPIETDETVAS
jgi:CelD/BcsL family acetyltransferase involved in cellulose biosynthesis